jgi:hypothetical protein
MATTAREPAVGNFGRKVAIGAAAGVATGLLANLLRKAAVQAPTAMAGNWDTALAAEHLAALKIFDLLEKTNNRATSRRSFLLMQLTRSASMRLMKRMWFTP